MCVSYDTHTDRQSTFRTLRSEPGTLRTDMQRKTYKVNEVAGILGIGRTTIYKLINQGELQRIKLGASTLIAADSLDALLSRNTA